MSAKKCLWGVSPRNDFTNEVVAMELAKTSDADLCIVNDNDGKEVKLYIVEHSFITFLSKSSNLNIKFLIYSKVGGAAWRECDLSKLKKPGKKIQSVINRTRKK